MNPEPLHDGVLFVKCVAAQLSFIAELLLLTRVVCVHSVVPVCPICLQGSVINKYDDVIFLNLC